MQVGKKIIPISKFLFKRQFSSSISPQHRFVPEHKPVNSDDIVKLKEFIERTKNLTVFTGAGISTESGIPDYRSKRIGLYARSRWRPVQYQQFIKSADVRIQYWTRNFVAWPQFSSHLPNPTHFAITQLQNDSIVDTVITMNVDGLHRKAGTSPLIELHGSAYEVICLECGDMQDRHQLQKTLRDLNPLLADMHLNQDVIRPDGDIEIPQEFVDSFKIASCQKCGGDLMPNVVFFGDNVPVKRVQTVQKCVDDTGGLLILGSSVSTYSAYRICLHAAKADKEIAIVNIDETRADSLATIKIEAKCTDVVPAVLTEQMQQSDNK